MGTRFANDQGMGSFFSKRLVWFLFALSTFGLANTVAQPRPSSTDLATQIDVTRKQIRDFEHRGPEGRKFARLLRPYFEQSASISLNNAEFNDVFDGIGLASTLSKRTITSADLATLLPHFPNRFVGDRGFWLITERLKLFPPSLASSSERLAYLKVLEDLIRFSKNFVDSSLNQELTELFVSEATRMFDHLPPEATAKKRFYDSAIAALNDGTKPLFTGVYYRSLGIDTTKQNYLSGANQLLLPKGDVSLAQVDSLASLAFHHGSMPIDDLVKNALNVRTNHRASLTFEQARDFWAELAASLYNTRKAEVSEAFIKLIDRADAHSRLSIAAAFEPYLAEAIFAAPKQTQLDVMVRFFRAAKDPLDDSFAEEVQRTVRLAKMKPNPTRVGEIWQSEPHDPYGLRTLAFMDDRIVFSPHWIKENVGVLFRHNVLSAVNYKGGLDDIPADIAELVLTRNAFANELRIETTNGVRRLVYRPESKSLRQAEILARAHPKLLSTGMTIAAMGGLAAFYGLTLPFMIEKFSLVPPAQMAEVQQVSAYVGLTVGVALGGICSQILGEFASRRANQNLPKPKTPPTL